MYSYISIGANVRNNTEILKKVPVKYLFDAIRNPKPEIANKIRQLRIVRQLNPTKYSELKRQLPYFVCAMFNPPFRKNENFAFTECFVVDVDHITEKGLIVSDVKEKIKSDGRVLLAFESPGGDGLKVVFHLKQRCYDAGVYSVFYKCFILKFSELYNLQQVVDSKTSDVSRACFISVDSDAYFNPNAEDVDVDLYVNTNDTLMFFDTKKDLDSMVSSAEKSESIHDVASADPDKETMDKIKHMLNPKLTKTKEKKMVYVPDILNDIIGGLRSHIEDAGVQIVEIENIQYGKKIKMKLGLKLAEINLFYGKRGFSVVQTPRTGTNAELNQLMAELVECYVAQL